MSGCLSTPHVDAVEPAAPSVADPTTPPLSSPPVPTPPTTPTAPLPVPTGYGSGTATYRYTFDGEVRCDQVVDLTLEPYAYPCVGCSFASAVDAVSVVDVSSLSFNDDCGPWSTGWADDTDWSWTYPLVEHDIRFGYAPAYTDAWGVLHPDALVRGFDVYDGYGGDDSHDQAWELWSSGDPQPPFALYPTISTYDGVSATSARTISTAWVDGPVCALQAFATAMDAAPPAAGAVVAGTVPCDGATAKAWSFEAVAGDVLQVAVDVGDPASGFDPHLGLSVDGCYLAMKDDVFDCTASMSPAGCPGVEVVAPQTGTYTVEVRAVGACTAGSGAFDVSVAGPAGLSLSAAPDRAGPPLLKYVEAWTLDLALDAAPAR